MRRCAWLLALLLASCLCDDTGGSAAKAFDTAKANPGALRAFLYRMPKGGDLHTHLSGAAYAEATIEAGAKAGRCFDPKESKIATCDGSSKPLSDALKHPDVMRELVNAWSMRGFVPTNDQNGHDHFFAAFALFGGAAPPGDLAADVVGRAGAQNERYIELMYTFQGKQVADLVDTVAKDHPWTGDFAAYTALLRDDLTKLAAAAKEEAAANEAAMRTALGCDKKADTPGCNVTVRWIHQVSRNSAPPRVFAATLFGAIAQQQAPHIVGLNFVAPEDYTVALTDYTLHMKMIGYVHDLYPAANVTLHAGELTLGVVEPKDLRFHIRQAVEIAHAKRIGHGVDVMYEEDPDGLLALMAKNKIAVEINLSSNDQILNVSGKAHPFPIYRERGVPVLLSTDDEGIERIDRTHELQRAVETYDLSYTDIVSMERNTLEYAFLPGASLWTNTVKWQRVAACGNASASNSPTPDCNKYLAANEKARLQWSLEADLARFESAATTKH